MRRYLSKNLWSRTARHCLSKSVFILGWGLLFCGCLPAQALDIKHLRDRCVVKSDGEWYTLYASYYTIDGCPEAQKAITQALFGKESDQIAKGYHQYVNSFQSIRPMREAKKTKDNEIYIKMEIKGNRGNYLSIVASNVISGKKIKKEKTIHLIWSERDDIILTATDILTSPYVEECQSKAGGAPLQFNLDNNGVNWGYDADGKYINTHIPYHDCDMVLNDAFKQLISFNKLKSRATTQELNELLVSSQAVDEEKIYNKVEQMPRFPGGEVQLSKYIATHGRYSEKMLTKDIQGGVKVSFIVEKDGSISHPQVMQDVNPELAKAVIKTIMNMPKWEPGRQKGVPVRVKQSLEIIKQINYDK